MIFALLFQLLQLLHSADTGMRIKDLVSIKGVRSNPLIGYGLIIGLNGTGDGGGEITNSSLKRMFQKLGLNPQQEITSKNVAAVIVTASLPPFARVGQHMDVHVSSIGDASSLAGGTLMVTPLKGGNGEIYALATGAVTLGGTKAGNKFGTSGKILQGAIVEKEIDFNFAHKTGLRLSVNDADFTTAHRIQKTINTQLGGLFAQAIDATTIDLIIPTAYQRKVVELMSIIENFKVFPDYKSKIVINERTGTIVAGGDITISQVALSHGDLSIEIKNEDGGDASTTVEKVFHVKDTVTMGDLVKALNVLKLSSDDLISIIAALKANGAISGEIQFL